MYKLKRTFIYELYYIPYEPRFNDKCFFTDNIWAKMYLNRFFSLLKTRSHCKNIFNKKFICVLWKYRGSRNAGWWVGPQTLLQTPWTPPDPLDRVQEWWIVFPLLLCLQGHKCLTKPFVICHFCSYYFTPINCNFGIFCSETDAEGDLWRTQTFSSLKQFEAAHLRGLCIPKTGATNRG